MRRHLPIFYSALLLTLVNLLLRLASTTFQVFVSGRIGAAGVGLLQLVMSVSSLALVAGIAGVRTAAMYLTAGELGRKKPENITWVLSGCFVYSFLASAVVGAALWLLAPRIADSWIRNPGTVTALRLFAAFLPAICLSAVMTGYFTAASRIGTLAAVEVAEQLASMAVTIALLVFWAGTDPVRACVSVVLGSCAASCLTLLCLLWLRLLERPATGARIPVARPLAEAALPLAAADILKSGINTTENLMVPRRLEINPRIPDALAAFGMVSGMVFPVMMFPACILYALAELLIPELARCAAGGSKRRIAYLVRRSLRVAMLYGIFFGGLEYVLARELCQKLYGSTDAAGQLQLYAVLIPMLYCDAITDAMTKGLGQQKICVRYNILTSAMDVVFLYFLLPRWGMEGYFLSFAVTHLINFLLSLRRLLIITGQHIRLSTVALSMASALAAVWGASFFPSVWGKTAGYCCLLGSLLCLSGVTGKEDLLWLRSLAAKEKRT